MSKVTDNYSLKISDIQSRDYPGGDLVIEQQLEDGDGYSKFLVSYPSDNLKIFALLTIPKSLDQNQKFPLVVFNRGFVDPAEYASDQQYLRYVDYFAKAGFAVFKSDYRGIGQSEGEIESVVNSANATDVLNGLASLKCHPELARPERDRRVLGSINFDQVFIWGHSMGGMVTLQCSLANNIFKAAAIWAGFIIPYEQIIDRWLKSPMPRQQKRAKQLLQQYGDPAQNPQIWRDISPFYFADQFPCQIQLHHGLKDKIIPLSDAKEFQQQLQKFGKDGGLITYQNGGHNLNEADVLPEAMANTIKFFKTNLSS